MSEDKAKQDPGREAGTHDAGGTVITMSQFHFSPSAPHAVTIEEAVYSLVHRSTFKTIPDDLVSYRLIGCNCAMVTP
jgi:hypothetical protein